MRFDFAAAPCIALLLALAAAPARAELPDVVAATGSAVGPPRSLRAERLLDRDWLRARGITAPARLVFDDEGALFVLDAIARRVVRLPLAETAGGLGPDAAAPTPLAYGEEVASAWLPSDLALDLRGSLLVLDRSSASVAAYGTRAEALGSRGIDPELSGEARAADARLARDPFGDLWLLAPRERDLVPLGTRLERRRAGRFLTPEDSLEGPVAVAFLPRGGGWIADAASRALRRFEPTGRFIVSVRPESPDGASFQPLDLASDRSGALYVADAAGGRVLVVSREGAVIATHWLGGPDRPWKPAAIAWGGDDRVAVADPSRGEIWILVVERRESP